LQPIWEEEERDISEQRLFNIYPGLTVDFLLTSIDVGCTDLRTKADKKRIICHGVVVTTDDRTS